MNTGVGNLPEGTPIVCRRCGGAMVLEGATSAFCRFCGARDELPADEAGRYLEIRARLSAARARTAQVQGMEAALARIFEDRRAFLRVSGIYLATGVVIFAVSVASMLMTSAPNAAVPSNIRLELWLGALTSPVLVFGLAASFGLALLGGRIHYRGQVRPLLLARPIDMGAAQFGCRACGAPLATGADISVTCRYCGSMNLIPKELHAAGGEALRRHAAEAARTMNTAHVRVGSIAARMQWILGAGIGLSVALAYTLPTVLGKLFGAGLP
jgi:ribosomal protein L40E